MVPCRANGTKALRSSGTGRAEETSRLPEARLRALWVAEAHVELRKGPFAKRFDPVKAVHEAQREVDHRR